MNILPTSLREITRSMQGIVEIMDAYKALPPLLTDPPVEPMPTFRITEDSICFTWDDRAVNRL